MLGGDQQNKDCFAILREGGRMGSDSRFDKRIERIVDLHGKLHWLGPAQIVNTVLPPHPPSAQAPAPACTDGCTEG